MLKTHCAWSVRLVLVSNLRSGGPLEGLWRGHGGHNIIIIISLYFWCLFADINSVYAVFSFLITSRRIYIYAQRIGIKIFLHQRSYGPNFAWYFAVSDRVCASAPQLWIIKNRCVVAPHVLKRERESCDTDAWQEREREREREGGRQSERERGAMCFLSARHSPPRDPTGWRSCLLSRALK